METKYQKIKTDFEKDALKITINKWNKERSGDIKYWKKRQQEIG